MFNLYNSVENMGIGPIGDCMQSILVPQYIPQMGGLVFPPKTSSKDVGHDTDNSIYASPDKERADIASALVNPEQESWIKLL